MDPAKNSWASVNTPDRDLPTMFARRDGFCIEEAKDLPEITGHIAFGEGPDYRYRAYRNGKLVSCEPTDRDARRYIRIRVDLDRYGEQTLDVSEVSFSSLREFAVNHADKRVRMTVIPAGSYYAISFEPDDGPESERII